jgi:hypothetical protein
MSSSNIKQFTRLNIILTVIFILFSGYIYLGFFFPDPVLLQIHWGPRTVLLGIKIFFPVLVLAIIYFYFAVRVKKIKPGAIILLFAAILILVSVLYPVGDYFYQKSLSKKISEFHPYLQIKPAEVPEIDHNSYNIFCLGGSTTEFKDKTGRDWTEMVGEKLKSESSDKQIKIYNFGRQWYTTQHSLTNYIQNLRKLKPDLLIVMHNINDLLHNADFSRFSSGKFRNDYGHFMGPLTNIVNRSSLMDMIVKSITGNWYFNEPELINTVEFAGLESFENNLNTLIELCENDKTKILLMTEPNIYHDSMNDDELNALHMLNTEAVGNGKQWSFETAKTGLTAYNEKIKEISNSKGTMLIDLEKKIPKSLEYFYDDVHYKDITYDLISDYIAGELNRLKPWKK